MVCQLINNDFSILIQIILGVFALVSLGVKRISENPRRPLNIFIYDVSKQVIGALYAHGLNLVIAIHVTNYNNKDNQDNKNNDQCMWYFINFIIDVFLGMTLSWLFLKLTNYIAVKKKYPFLISGKYLITKYYCNLSYCLQLIIWLMIITIVKLILFYGVLIPFSSSLATIGTTILSPISNNDEVELIIVMIVVPFSLNIIQFWIQDTFLKHDNLENSNNNIDNIDNIDSPITDISPTNQNDRQSQLEDNTYLEFRDIHDNDNKNDDDNRAYSSL